MHENWYPKNSNEYTVFTIRMFLNSELFLKRQDVITFLKKTTEIKISIKIIGRIFPWNRSKYGTKRSISI